MISYKESQQFTHKEGNKYLIVVSVFSKKKPIQIISMALA